MSDQSRIHGIGGAAVIASMTIGVVAFLAAIIARYLWLLSRLLRGRDPQAGDVTKVSSGL